MSKYTQTNSRSAQSISEGIPRMLSSPSVSIVFFISKQFPLPTSTSIKWHSDSTRSRLTLSRSWHAAPTLGHSGTCRMYDLTCSNSLSKVAMFHNRSHLVDVKHLMGQVNQQRITNQTIPQTISGVGGECWCGGGLLNIRHNNINNP